VRQVRMRQGCVRVRQGCIRQGCVRAQPAGLGRGARAPGHRAQGTGPASCSRRGCRLAGPRGAGSALWWRSGIRVVNQGQAVRRTRRARAAPLAAGRARPGVCRAAGQDPSPGAWGWLVQGTGCGRGGAGEGAGQGGGREEDRLGMWVQLRAAFAATGREGVGVEMEDGKMWGEVEGMPGLLDGCMSGWRLRLDERSRLHCKTTRLMPAGNESWWIYL